MKLFLCDENYSNIQCNTYILARISLASIDRRPQSLTTHSCGIGGAHVHLAAVSRRSQSVYSFDSEGSTFDSAAVTFAKRLQEVLGTLASKVRRRAHMGQNKKLATNLSDSLRRHTLQVFRGLLFMRVGQAASGCIKGMRYQEDPNNTTGRTDDQHKFHSD
eukprot:94116-Amphidinium_carterae.1